MIRQSFWHVFRDSTNIPFPKFKKQKARMKKWLNLKGWWVKPIWKKGSLRLIAWHLKMQSNCTTNTWFDHAHTQMRHQASGGETFMYVCVHPESSSLTPLPWTSIKRGAHFPNSTKTRPRSPRLLPQNVTSLVLTQQMDIPYFSLWLYLKC